jgi:hypothetical protein
MNSCHLPTTQYRSIALSIFPSTFFSTFFERAGLKSENCECEGEEGRCESLFSEERGRGEVRGSNDI